MRGLKANEPAIYREVNSAALEELRPDMEIFISEPDDLEGSSYASCPSSWSAADQRNSWSARLLRGSSSTPVALRMRS
jgi:hypothetical protein